MNDRRRFGIADGLILVAGIGVGLGLVRYIDPGLTFGRLWSVLSNPPGGWTPWEALQISTELCVLFVTPFFAAWTPACLLLQLQRPRPRHLRRAPGFIGCLLPTLGCTLTVAITWLCLGTTAWHPLHPNQGDYEQAQVVGGLIVGSGVLWAWATMQVCGIFRARPTWTDRLGRMTGAIWIVIGMLSGAYLLLLI